MTSSFRERIKNEILVCDGAMGTMLYAKGIYINRCFDELNLSNPKIVKDIHQEYIDAGADIIETNTFGANRFKLIPHGLEDKIYEINYWGALLAKEIAGYKNFVAGSMGPLGRPIEPIGNIPRQDARAAFTEQAEALVNGGIDIFILETFNDINQLECAIEAVQSVSVLPIIAQVSFSDEAKTIFGVTATQVVTRLDNLHVDVIGVNCSTGPQPILDEIEQMAALTKTRLSAMPNAGMPKLVDGRLIYLASPEYFAEYAKRFIQTGVSIVGGCCGTTPEHIRAIKAAVKALRPTRLIDKVKTIEAHETPTTVTREAVIKSEFNRKIKEGQFVTSIEINPPRSPNSEKVIESCLHIKGNHVDLVNIPDGPRASARMSPLALATLIESQSGLETILHYTCRDRNILGMQSDLMGAHALGLRNILIVTGDPPKLGDYPTATAVFNVDSIGLLRIASNLNNGMDLAGNPIESATSFYLGAGANPGAINRVEEFDRLKQKIEAGAEYILTQPIFESSLFDQFMDFITQFNVPVLAGIMPLASYRNAEFLHNEVPGMVIPLEIRNRLEAARTSDDARKIGIEIAQEMLLHTKPTVQGIYLMPPFGRYNAAIEVFSILAGRGAP
ncbi:bifunctional homocysteine S-methyltransferase/methylenetetrahydrofolate reductase [candidate division KSB1 bacterium]|nr:bifunctional homocysteine S-methyltransferase/methylenetetrahydrofolate reductase [candidate division KSB1 bacterium]